MEGVGLILDISGRIAERAQQAVANQDDCKKLAELAAKTASFIHQLEKRGKSDFMMSQALEFILKVLQEVGERVESCCRFKFLACMIYSNNHKFKLQ